MQYAGRHIVAGQRSRGSNYDDAVGRETAMRLDLPTPVSHQNQQTSLRLGMLDADSDQRLEQTVRCRLVRQGLCNLDEYLGVRLRAGELPVGVPGPSFSLQAIPSGLI